MLVVVAVLAAIAIPSYQMFMGSTKVKAAKASAQTYVSQARAIAALSQWDRPGATLQQLPEAWVGAGQDMEPGGYIEGVPTPLPADATPTDLNGDDPGLPSFELIGGELSGPIDFGYGIDDNYYPVQLTVVGNEVSIVGEEAQESPPPLAVAPGAPTGVSGSRATSTSATVSFSAPASDGGASITSYTATCTSSDEGDPGTSSGATSPLTVSSLTEGKTYTCSVTATNSAGISPSSSASAAFTLIVVPDTPANLAAEPTSAGDDRLVFTWDPVASTTDKPVTGYALYQLNPVTELYEVAALIPGQESNTYTLSGLTTGTTYSFVIASTNAAGEGSRSGAMTATPIGVPDAATITGTGLGNETISIDWTATSTAAGPITGFRLYLDGVEVTTVGSAVRTYTYTGLTAGTEYDLEVRSYNTMGETEVATTSDEVTETAITAIDQVSWANPASTVTDTSVTLNWTPLTSTAAKPVTGYALYKLNTDTDVYDLVTLIPGASADSYEVTGLISGTTYSFKITGYNTLGEGERSATTTATPITVPNAATITGTTFGAGTATITWTASATSAAPITGFRLYRDGVSVTTVSSTTLTYTFTGLTAGVTYTLEARAYNTRGEVAAAAASDETTVTAIGPASAPQSLTATAGNAQSALAWTAPSSNGGSPITGYAIDMTTDGGSTWSVVTANTGSTTTSYTATGLSNGPSYQFRVAARNAAGTGTYAISNVSRAVLVTIQAYGGKGGTGGRNYSSGSPGETGINGDVYVGNIIVTSFPYTFNFTISQGGLDGGNGGYGGGGAGAPGERPGGSGGWRRVTSGARYAAGGGGSGGSNVYVYNPSSTLLMTGSGGRGGNGATDYNVTYDNPGLGGAAGTGYVNTSLLTTTSFTTGTSAAPSVRFIVNGVATVYSDTGATQTQGTHTIS